MPTSPTLTEQLATLGVNLPAWPEEPEGSGITGDWIQRGQAYAEGLRLWQAQLRTAAEFDGAGGKRLTAVVQNLGKQSNWDQGVARYLLADLKAGTTYERVQAAAKLVAVHGRTPAQLVGAGLALARDGLFVCAVGAIKQLAEVEQVSAAKCIDLCALLVANSAAAAWWAAPEADGEGGLWLQNIALHLQACRVLASAASIASGEQPPAELVNQLDALAALAATGHSEPECDEYAAILQVKTRERRKQTRPQGKPLLRTIHHLACTGGTVISKCLAAMPNVALISEVNPRNRTAGGPFQPTNPLLLLERSYRQLTEEEVEEEFLQQISSIMKICAQDDVDLVIRDHSQTDFCLGPNPSSICSVVDYLSPEYALRSVLTVRHPLDSYLGLLANKWVTQFTPSTLDEYSRRCHAFLDRYSTVPLRRYEDFCANPAPFIEDICEMLEISYHPAFISRYQDIRISGYSDRKKQALIAAPPRRPIPSAVQAETENSESYMELIVRLGYD